MAALKIRKVYANQPSFQEITLNDGLNLILAERSEGSSEHDSRNGVGKSTFIEVLHFCLGSSLTAKSVISQLRNSDWQFGLELEIDGARIHVRRSFSAPNQVIVSGNLRQLGLEDENRMFPDEGQTLSVKAWKDFLGSVTFGLGKDIVTQKFSPTFRALITYFARSDRDGYIDPFTTSRQVRTWQKQVFNAYLVGLNWNYASQWEELREEEKAIRTINKGSATRNRELMYELENERVRLIAEQRRLEEQVSNFVVVPEYKVIETEARALTRQMRDLANESAILSQMLEKYEEQMESESSGDLDKVQQIFEEAGLLFPEQLSRNLDQVVAFHSQVTQYRRDYLSNEIIRLRKQVHDNQQRLAELDQQRSTRLRMLNTGGAVEELGALQVKLGRTLERLQVVDNRLSSLETVTADEANVASGRQALLSRALLDRAERRARWSAVIANFVAATEYLYDNPGTLNFGVNENGYTFQTKMPRSGSDGVENMAIYAYDIALTQVWSAQLNRPGFLVHDSILYEGVDERQVALALNYAKEQAERYDFQYVALLNTDDLPTDDLAQLGLDWRRYVRRELDDSNASSTLLGFRF
ncbi:DUF2326 domain-containing protein [Microbispora sp. NPDC088329]|uniref:DUF2326 domain-containing protein n=1 Tax=Microbispora sp. NPDC088329 TaxID=3154869 RepID=UPI00344836D8